MNSLAQTVDLAKLASALSVFLLTGLLLALVFLLASYVLVRALRRIRRSIDWRRAAPTAVEDVWAMHKLPEDMSDE